MEKAIDRAHSAGWNSAYGHSKNVPTSYSHIRELAALLSPDFWLALGKAEGWETKKFYSHDGIHVGGQEMPEARWYSRCFWNELWQGKTPEEFFTKILK